jgi:DNA repair exonuclease SbcCD nuclease subunit
LSVQFIHCSDLHLDRNFNIFDSAKAQKRKDDLNNNFSKIVDYAIKNKPDLFFITGDIFDRIQPSNVSRVFLVKKIKELAAAGIKVFAIAGNHDIPKLGEHPSLAIDVLSIAEFATVFSDSKSFQKETLKIDGKNVCICGKSYFSQLDQRNPLRDDKVSLDGDYNIMLLHASLLGLNVSPSIPSMVNYNPFYASDMPPKLDYVGLGHFHNHFERDYNRCKILNPGSIEKLSWSEASDEKGFVWGELNERGVQTEFISLPCRHMEQKDLHLTPEISDIDNAIGTFLSGLQGCEKIFKLNIKGTITLEQYSRLRFNEIYSKYNNLFFHLQINREELEIEKYGRVFLSRIDNPKEGFAKRIDTLLSLTREDNERSMLSEVKTLGMKYLEAASQ